MKKLISFTVISLFIFGGNVYARNSSLAQDRQMKTAIGHSYVCFINDTFMNRPQIPVEIEGKTYYGCCAGCAKRLRSDRSKRFSNDPLTSKEVDKATAFIVLDTDQPDFGKVLYFESEGNYLAFIKQKRKK